MAGNTTRTEFENKVFWVTGASGALGHATARALAEQGATVVASSRSVSDIQFGHSSIDSIPVDVRDDGSIRQGLATLLERHGRIDGLVTSTNVSTFGEFLDLTDEDWRGVIEAKLLGSVRPVRAALPKFIEQKSGAIVLISGRGGIEPPPHHFPGSSVNAALDLLVQGLGRRYGPHGVRVNAVDPGPIESPRLNTISASAGAGHSNDTALSRLGKPEDVANAVAFLLSTKAAFITGTRLYVDGGGKPYP